MFFSISSFSSFLRACGCVLRGFKILSERSYFCAEYEEFWRSRGIAVWLGANARRRFSLLGNVFRRPVWNISFVFVCLTEKVLKIVASYFYNKVRNASLYRSCTYSFIFDVFLLFHFWLCAKRIPELSFWSDAFTPNECKWAARLTLRFNIFVSVFYLREGRVNAKPPENKK